MKLRNKKTGEIRDIKGILIDGIFTVNSLAELNKEWEDYAPKEPLIKDEKICKAVRAWAKENNVMAIWVDYEEQLKSDLLFNRRTRYTIAELCGDEE